MRSSTCVVLVALFFAACESKDPDAETLPCSSARTQADCEAIESQPIDDDSGFGFTACNWVELEIVDADCSLQAGPSRSQCVQVEGIGDACIGPMCGDHGGVAVREIDGGNFEVARNQSCSGMPSHEGFQECDYDGDTLAPGCACACDAFGAED